MLNLIQRMQARREKRHAAQLSDLDRYRQLIAKAAQGGDLPAKESDELLDLADRLGFDSETLEARVESAVQTVARFNAMRASAKTLPKLVEATTAAKAKFDAATAALDAAKKELEESERAYNTAIHQQSEVTSLRDSFRRIISEESEVLPDLTLEDFYFCSSDFMLGNKPSGEYPDPRKPAPKPDYSDLATQTSERPPMTDVRYVKDRTADRFVGSA